MYIFFCNDYNNYNGNILNNISIFTHPVKNAKRIMKRDIWSQKTNDATHIICEANIEFLEYFMINDKLTCVHKIRSVFPLFLLFYCFLLEELYSTKFKVSQVMTCEKSLTISINFIPFHITEGLQFSFKHIN